MLVLLFTAILFVYRKLQSTVCKYYIHKYHLKKFMKIIIFIIFAKSFLFNLKLCIAIAIVICYNICVKSVYPPLSDIKMRVHDFKPGISALRDIKVTG